jgi:hypothetical protein
MPAKKRKTAKKKTTSPKKRKTLKETDIQVAGSSRIIVTRDSDTADGTDKKTDPKTGHQPDSDFRDHGDPKR